MPFLRLTRDQRGYETTLLLHAAHHGESPRVLYWYRSAPGVRVGRRALDEDAIRAIEEQHPEIEFDWAQILEIGAAMAADIDHRAERGAQRGTRPGDPERGPERGPQRGTRGGDPDRARRTPIPTREQPTSVHEPEASVPLPGSLSAAAPAIEPEPEGPIETQASDDRQLQPQPPPEVARRGADVLSELVGREIATRLRARYAAIIARVEEHGCDAAVREAWRARAAALNPDSWVTPEEILRGMQQADRLFDELRRDLDSAR